MITRVITALVLLAIVFAAILAPTPYGVLGLCFLAALACGIELATLVGLPRWTACLVLVGVALPAFIQAAPLGWAALFILGVVPLWRATVAKLPLTSLAGATLWIGVPLGLLYLMRIGGIGVLLTALIPIWAGDTAAIFVGKAWGKHPLAPKISPKKTVEGAIGNGLAAVLAGTICARTFELPLYYGLACGISAATVGQMGDLFESWIKRTYDAKDAGSLLPGHGGVLDRIDAMLFATVPSFIAFWYLIGPKVT